MNITFRTFLPTQRKDVNELMAIKATIDRRLDRDGLASTAGKAEALAREGAQSALPMRAAAMFS